MTFFQIKDKAKQYTEYDMIQAYVDLPEFPNNRTQLLYAFLSTRYQQPQSELFALVTSLVQMGLDTHDTIAAEASDYAASGLKDRTRQLSVLAGDYFSGRFYQLLAQAGQIDMIRKLSNAICEVNRIKLTLYMKMKQFKCTAEDYLKQTVSIKTQLFLTFNHWLDGQHQAVWSDVLASFTRCEVISEEIRRLKCVNDFKHSWAYWFIFQQATDDEREQLMNAEGLDESRVREVVEQYQIGQVLKGMLSIHITELQTCIEKHTAGTLTQELRNMLNPFLHLVTPVKVAEESS